MAKHQHLPTCFAALALALLSGCALWMRDPDFYTAEVNDLLESHTDTIEACYDRYLATTDPKAQGQVVVTFQVEKRTGELTHIEVDPQQSTAPPGLAACITNEMAQMRLEPVDTKTAHASFTWEFARGAKKAPPADPFADSQIAVLACYSAHLSEVDREAQGDLVIDYELNSSGAVERLDVVAETTTAPAPVVECATLALRAARLDPTLLDERNTAGRRTFTLRYQSQ